MRNKMFFLIYMSLMLLCASCFAHKKKVRKHNKPKKELKKGIYVEDDYSDIIKTESLKRLVDTTNIPKQEEENISIQIAELIDRVFGMDSIKVWNDIAEFNNRYSNDSIEKQKIKKSIIELNKKHIKLLESQDEIIQEAKKYEIGVQRNDLTKRIDFDYCDVEAIKRYLSEEKYNYSRVEELSKLCSDRQHPIRILLDNYCKKNNKARELMQVLINANDPMIARHIYDNTLEKQVLAEFNNADMGRYGLLYKAFLIKRTELKSYNNKTNPFKYEPCTEQHKILK